MKRDFRKHLQKYCDISNWSRMHNPRRGKENYEEAVALAEDILRMLLDREPGYDGTAVMMTAVALVERYVSGAQFWSNAFEVNSGVNLLDKYKNLFEGEFWMGLREDAIEFQVGNFIRGEQGKSDPLGIY